MIDKVNKFPLTKVNDFLWEVFVCEMNDTDLSILRREMLICQKRIVDDPFLRKWLLWVFKFVGFLLVLLVYP